MLTFKQHLSEPDCAQKGNQLKGEPAEKEGSHDCSQDPQGPVGFNHAFFVYFGSNEPVADSDNGHRHAEANDEPDDPSDR